ncbi:isochorismate synthase [Microbacterium sp. No. 7]|uniref:isochorismate synthase n=1 Tax=Microbacterium sp. No. 7 TaxID=1714373 RepID=UPI0006D1314A|nr:isochorismate synthase [Microbacterium sp. No. 7]
MTGQKRVLFAGDTTVDGAVVRTLRGAGSSWADEVIGGLAPGERAVAALSFEPDGPGVAHVVSGGTDDRGREAPSGDDPERSHRIEARPTPEEYAANVRFALERIRAGAVQKVVLGRGLDVFSTPPLEPAAVLGGLLRRRPGRYVFGVPLDDGPESPQLIGASPELLVRRTGRDLVSFPLAGSVPRSDDPVRDLERAALLAESAKDLAEHAFVVDEIVAMLRPHCVRIEADAAPRVISTDTLHHLGTQIRAELADPSSRALSALHVAQLLQPTPAVGGVPRRAALDVIARLESDRGPLTGAVGWVDADGDGEFAVTIRAGVLEGDRLRLYAGAGIVAGSDPDAEVRETGAKLATMLGAVGL